MEVTNLLDTLSQAASSLNIEVGTTETQRQDLYRACEKLSAGLETPIDRLMRTSFDVSAPRYLQYLQYQAAQCSLFRMMN